MRYYQLAKCEVDKVAKETDQKDKEKRLLEQPSQSMTENEEDEKNEEDGPSTPAEWIGITIIMIGLSVIVLGFCIVLGDGDFSIWALLFGVPLYWFWLVCLHEVFLIPIWGRLELKLIISTILLSGLLLSGFLDEFGGGSLLFFPPLCGFLLYNLLGFLNYIWLSRSKIYQFCSPFLLGLIDILIMIIYIRFSWELIEPLFY